MNDEGCKNCWKRFQQRRNSSQLKIEPKIVKKTFLNHANTILFQSLGHFLLDIVELKLVNCFEKKTANDKKLILYQKFFHNYFLRTFSE